MYKKLKHDKMLQMYFIYDLKANNKKKNSNNIIIGINKFKI